MLEPVSILHSFLWLSNVPFYRYTTYIHSFVDRHLGGFYLLVIASNASINLGVQISVLAPAFNSFWYVLSSGIAGSHGNSMFTFLRNY